MLSESFTNNSMISKVTNDGPLEAKNVQLRIHWPKQLYNEREQGKWLLYLTRKPTVVGGKFFTLKPMRGLQAVHSDNFVF